MSLASLNPNEKEVIRLAMVAMAEERVLAEFEFETRVGIGLEQFRTMLARWPDIEDKEDSSDGCLAINNTLNDILYGEGIPDSMCREWFGVSRDELERIYRRWAELRGWSATGVR